MHKVLKGSADKSYGIQVAKLAGLPREIINRANHILSDLERKNIYEDDSRNVAKEPETIFINDESDNKNKEKQLKFDDFIEPEIIKDLKNINLLETTPIDALNILYKLQKKATKL